MVPAKFIAYVISAGVLIIAVSGFSENSNIANKYFLEKQKFIYEIVHNLQEPVQNDEWIHVGRTLVLDAKSYVDFNSLMIIYLTKISTNSLLPLDEAFIMSNEKHLEELQGLYYFLFNAQDFGTLRQNICWARTHVQPQMFLFALTQILMKREDFKDLKLPKIYEIWPQHFFADKYIKNLKHFNYIQWSKTDMYAEYFKEPNITKLSKCKVGQWWCEKNLQFKIYKEMGQNLLPEEEIYGDVRNSSKWRQALEEVALYWLPVDFSREVSNTQQLAERSLTYLTEDITWNAYWYYINMGLWLNEKGENDMYGKTLRDWWYWNLQQIVARYKIEATSLSNKFILDPLLINYQGRKFKPVNEKSFGELRTFINDLFVKTDNALNAETFQLQNKSTLQLNNPQHFEYFLNEHFAIEKVIKAFMSVRNKHDNNPTVFQYFETMLRSKEFYYYAEIISSLYKALKTKFERFKPQDLHSVGVTINNVEITELTTFFEIHDTDVTNILRLSNNYFEGQFLWFKSLMARQQTLQHQPFKFVFNFTSDKPQAILVRTFLSRDCSADEKCSYSNDIFQLDTFVSSLTNGFNLIERKSKDFYGYMQPSLTYTEMYQFTKLALNEEFDFPLNMTWENCRFPSHLKLPKGVKGEGLPIKFFFIVTAYNYHFHKASNLNCDFSSGILAFDDLPPGFPFNRDITPSIYLTDNVFIKKMKIYHDDYRF